MAYRVRGKVHRRIDSDGRQVEYQPGDPIDPTPAELAAFPDRFAEVDNAADRAVEGAGGLDPAPLKQGGLKAGPAEDKSGESSPPNADPAEMTIAEVMALVEAGTLDPAAALKAERAGKDRVTLTRQLEAKIEQDSSGIPF